MARPIIVRLDREITPVFPRRCVVCAREHPASSLRLFTRDELRGYNLLAGWFTVRVPCCVPCGRWLRVMRVGRFFWTLLAASAWLFFGVFYLVECLHWPGVKCGLITLGGICVTFLAEGIWREWLCPPAFNIDVTDAYVDYKFRRYEDAALFAKENGQEPVNERGNTV